MSVEDDIRKVIDDAIKELDISLDGSDYKIVTILPHQLIHAEETNNPKGTMCGRFEEPNQISRDPLKINCPLCLSEAVKPFLDK